MMPRHAAIITIRRCHATRRVFYAARYFICRYDAATPDFTYAIMLMAITFRYADYRLRQPLYAMPYAFVARCRQPCCRCRCC